MRCLLGLFDERVVLDEKGVQIDCATSCHLGLIRLHDRLHLYHHGLTLGWVLRHLRLNELTELAAFSHRFLLRRCLRQARCESHNRECRRDSCFV
jgi:hypothetical protein